MFTGQLGTSNSGLANIELGTAAPTGNPFMSLNDSADARDTFATQIFLFDSATARDFLTPPPVQISLSDSANARDALAPAGVMLNFVDSTSTDARDTMGLLAGAIFLNDSATARDAIAIASLVISLADRATTRDSAVSNSGNIGNGRYDR